MSAGLKVNINADGEQVIKSNDDLKLLAPLPALGFRANYHATKKLQFIGSVDYFGLTSGNLSGRLTELQIAAEYALFNNFGVGIGFNTNNIHVQLNKEIKYKVNQTIAGGEVYLSYRY